MILVEKYISDQLDTKELISEFTKIKARKVNLKLKKKMFFKSNLSFDFGRKNCQL